MLLDHTFGIIYCTLLWFRFRTIQGKDVFRTAKILMHLHSEEQCRVLSLTIARDYYNYKPVFWHVSAMFLLWISWDYSKELIMLYQHFCFLEHCCGERNIVFPQSKSRQFSQLKTAPDVSGGLDENLEWAHHSCSDVSLEIASSLPEC